MAKRIFYIIVILSILTGCNFFNVPLKDHIENATSTVTELGIIINTINTVNNAEGFIAIPPADEAEETQITVNLRNIQNHDLSLSFEGTGANSAFAKLSEDKQQVTITIKNGARNTEYDLTLLMEANSRPMPPIKLPKLVCKYFNNDLVSVILTPLDDMRVIRDNPVEVNISILQASFSFGTRFTDIEIFLPEGVYSTAVINGMQVNEGTAFQIPTDSGSHIIEIVVTADCGISRNYTLTIDVGFNNTKSITAFSFNIAGETYTGEIDGNAITVTVPNGTNVTALTPTVVHTGVSYSPTGQQNFTHPVNYTITAADTTSSIYTVTVEISSLESVTVTFDKNTTDTSVIGPEPSTKNVTNSLPFGTLAAISRTGYIFNGWYTASSGGTEVTSATIVTETNDYTVYAQWSGDLSYAVINIPAVTYTGGAQEPTNITVTHDSYTLVQGVHYSIGPYGNNINAGTATVMISALSGSGYAGDRSVNFTINPAPITSVSFTIDIPVTGEVPAAAAAVSVVTIPASQPDIQINWTPADNLFQGDTEYSVSVTLTRSSNNYSFTNIDGSSSITSSLINDYAATLQSYDNSVSTFVYTFSATDPIPAQSEVYLNISVETIGHTLIVTNITGSTAIYRTPGTTDRPTSATLVLDNHEDYQNIKWEIEGTGINAGTLIQLDPPTGGNQWQAVVDAANTSYNSPGGHLIYLTVMKDGVPYSATILITIEN